MIDSLVIFISIVAVIIVLIIVIRFIIEYQNTIFSIGLIIFGAILVIIGIILLVKVGGGIGAIGIFIALWGGGLIYMAIDTHKK